MTGKRARIQARFAGQGPRAEALVRHRSLVVDLVRVYGGRDVHVFGSVARGTDHDASDIDLVFLAERQVSMFGSLHLHQSLREVLGCRVDIFSASELPAHTLDEIAREAVPL